MLRLTELEISTIFGGTGETTPPTCTTSGNTTSCTCPSGYRLSAGSDGTKMVMDCVKI
jgi:hypothetical protein